MMQHQQLELWLSAGCVVGGMLRPQQLEQWLSAGCGVGGMLRPAKSAPCSPVKPPAAPSQAAILRTHSDSFHVAYMVPVGDTPYVRAKRVQLVDKDPEKVSLRERTDLGIDWVVIFSKDPLDLVCTMVLGVYQYGGRRRRWPVPTLPPNGTTAEPQSPMSPN